MKFSKPFQITESNHKRVLNAIRISNEISGADLARNIGLQPSTITYILRSLKDKGLIKVSGTGESTNAGGKRPTLWQINPDAGYIIGLELIYHEIRISIIDFCGTIYYQKIIYQSDLNKNKSIDLMLKDTILDSIKDANISTDKIIGIGLAVSGIINLEQNQVDYSNMLKIKEIPLKSILQKQLDFPVFIANDANAGALGIQWYLANPDQDLNHIIYLTINEDANDIGAGLILNGQLYKGSKGSAGEIFASLNTIIEIIRKAKIKFANTSQDEFPLNLKETIKNAQQDQKISNWILDQWSQTIVDTMDTIICLLNPSQIIMGGDIAQSDWLINQKIIQKLNQKIEEKFPEIMTPPAIEASQFGVHSVSMGATALVLREIMGE